MGSDSDDVYRVRELLIGDGIQHGPELPSIAHILDTMHPLYRQILENFYKMKMRGRLCVRCSAHDIVELGDEKKKEEAPAPGVFGAESGVPEPAPQAGAATDEAAVAGAAEVAETAAEEAPVADGAEAAEEGQVEEAAVEEEAAIEMQQPADDGEEEEVELREIHLRTRTITVPMVRIGRRTGEEPLPPFEVPDLSELPGQFHDALGAAVEEPYRMCNDAGRQQFECRIPGCGFRRFDTLRGWKAHVSLSSDHHANGFCHQCSRCVMVPAGATLEQRRAALRRHKEDWCPMAPKATMKMRRARRTELALLGRKEELESIYIPGEPEAAIPEVVPPVPRRQRHLEEEARECAVSFKRLRTENPDAFKRLREELEL